MASVNKWIGIGNLGRDPEVRYSPDGVAICNISIACTSTWKDKATGERKEETEWVRVVFYNRLAEIAGEYLKKGRSVYVEGRLKTRKWQDKETGADRYSTDIVADQMQMLSGDRSDQQEQPTRHHEDRKHPGAPVNAPARNSYADATGRAQPAQQSLPQGTGGLADMADDCPW